MATPSDPEAKVEVNCHFYTPKPPPQAPWQRPLQERRHLSRDPTSQLRVQQSQAFSTGMLSGVFEHVQNWLGSILNCGNRVVHMDSEWRTILVQCGLTNEFLLVRLYRIFDVFHANQFTILDFLSVLQLMLEGQFKGVFVQSCFSMLDVRHAERIFKADLQAEGPKGRKVSRPAVPSLEQSAALLECFRLGFTASPREMLLSEFEACFQKSPQLVASLLGRLLEAAASVYAQQDAPKPVTRHAVTEPEMSGPPKIWDCDGWLLREVDKAGGITPTMSVVKKRRKSARKRSSPKA
eukprot:TRINITY_DN84009_c0_g1_i1.p1 TRINITY_DN84009_c0_g1~~TRINITY_DN84009_c0_g1_i1.p1  ORF type:complete len:294 (+),score=33.21 TRINITY_DN84009_c0_g1_i1:61-942(+)